MYVEFDNVMFLQHKKSLLKLSGFCCIFILLHSYDLSDF